MSSWVLKSGIPGLYTKICFIEISASAKCESILEIDMTGLIHIKLPYITRFYNVIAAKITLSFSFEGTDWGRPCGKSLVLFLRRLFCASCFPSHIVPDRAHRLLNSSTITHI